jgi:hypothetical protein
MAIHGFLGEHRSFERWMHKELFEAVVLLQHRLSGAPTMAECALQAKSDGFGVHVLNSGGVVCDDCLDLSAHEKELLTRKVLPNLALFLGSNSLAGVIVQPEHVRGLV